jgi:acyl-CoA synthetase (NDP forming)
MSLNPIDEVLGSRSVAVVGATRDGGWGGGGFVAGLLPFGFKGKVYPVNPKYAEIQGLKAYPSLNEIPDNVDYVISSVPAREVPDLLDAAARKKTKVVHLFTARLAETGRPEAIELEKRILRQAKEYGIRLIGPNCMGVYSPGHGIAFHGDFPKEPGPVGLVSQSGMLAREIVLAGPLRGVNYSRVFSYGNAIDLNESDFLEYLARDADTTVIMMYVEGVKNGRRFFQVLKKAAAAKPVIVLKGGRGGAGARATASHTASLAGALQVWDAAVRQAGAVPADSFEELIDLAVSFRFLPQVKGKRVGVAGGAGGSSVLAADQCEQAGLDVIPLPPAFREDLRRRGVSVWDWLSNPADISIREDDTFSVGLVLEMMARDPSFDVLIAIMGMPGRMPPRPGVAPENVLEEQYHLAVTREKPFLAVVPDRTVGVSDLEGRELKMMAELRTALVRLGIPYYPTVGRAALAARKVYQYHRQTASRNGVETIG